MEADPELAFEPSPMETCCKCGAEGPVQRCSCCKLAFYCSEKCQKRAWKSHKRVCCEPPLTLLTTTPTNDIRGIYMPGGRGVTFNPSARTVPPEHPVWNAWRHGGVSPVSQLIGVPLLIHREHEELPLDTPNIAEKDNQSVTYLMIDPETGFAAPRWQKNIGPVTIVRADQQPLTKVDLEKIWMYCDRILDRFGDDPRPPLFLYKPEEFEDFCEDYVG